MNTTRTTSVVGLYDSEERARQALEGLRAAGFSRDQVHLGSNESYTGDIASGGSALTGQPAQRERQGGGFLGWIRSAFGGSDYDDDYTRRYDAAARRGAFVVAVSVTEDRIDSATDILNEYGAIDVDEHASTHGYGGQAYRESGRDLSSSESVPVVEEELRIGKRPVQRGGVRVFSRVVEEPVSQDIRLREERVIVERRPVDRPLSAAGRDALTEQTIEVTEMAEEPIIEKQARVVEEIRVGKEVNETTETVRDTVRRTQVETQPIGSGTAAQDDDPAYQYGYRMAGDQRYRGRSWSDVESSLRSDYLRSNPNSTWDKVSASIRRGWEKVTNQR
ncbi:MAG: YsnF/AvaK domain-containing protein [Bryobacteraceae bacterium]|nr:YsnF/AvaK domain-containing protein [Bryobacteraceae bacterium]